MLDPEDLAPVDEAVLDMLQDGRVTAPFVGEETDYNVQYVRDRLTRMVEHGNARKAYEGLYELVEDPREDTGTPPDETTAHANPRRQELKGGSIDAAQLRTALDDVETAAERGDGAALQDALRRAREGIDDGE
jgi:hypothetical protein